MDSYKRITDSLEKVFKSLKKDKADFIFLTPGGGDNKIKKYISSLQNEIITDTFIIGKKESKNAIVIYDNYNIKVKNFDNDMENFRSLYPIIIVIIDIENNKYLEKKYTGWTSKIDDDNQYVFFLNRNIKKFDSFIIEDKSFLHKEANEVKGTKNKIKTYKNVEKDEEKIEPVSKKLPNEPNFDMFKMLPEPTVQNDPTSKVWKNEFYTYLKYLLTIIVPPNLQSKIKFILNSETIDTIWIPAFTSELYNPNLGENYEIYEKIGDAIMAYDFFLYMTKRYPNLADQNRLTEWKKKILSAGSQGVWGEKMKLYKWGIMPPSIYEIGGSNLKLKEDLIESFCGALDAAFNKYVSNGYGSICVYNLIKIVLDDYEFEIDPTTSKTRLEQFIEMINTSRKITEEKKIVLPRPINISNDIWDQVLQAVSDVLYGNGITEQVVGSKDEIKKDKGIEEKIEQNEDGAYITRIYLKKSGSDVLKEKGINIKAGTLLGESISPTKKPGSEKAYSKALEAIASYGITDEWIKDRQREKNRFNLSYLDEALYKARSINKDIKEIEVVNPKTYKNDKIYQIIGYNEEGKKYIVHTYIPTIKKGNLKQETINDWLEK